VTPESLERVLSWNEVLDESTYYEILGVLEIADQDALREAFHDFARSFHPDAFPEADAEAREALKRVFQRGTEAYRVLIRPELRQRYDLALAKGQLRLFEGSRDENAPRSDAAVRSLDELCKTAAARRYATRADEFITQGKLSEAKRELALALQHDGENPELAERLDALDLALFAMGS
jgi:DnaJ-class molecular chaperone